MLDSALTAAMIERIMNHVQATRYELKRDGDASALRVLAAKLREMARQCEDSAGLVRNGATTEG